MQTGMRLFPQRERSCRDMVRGKRSGSDSVLYHTEAFQEVLHRETARSLRSGRPFLLALIDVSGSGEAPTIIASLLSSSTREIDTKGWYAEGEVLGVLFTEFGSMCDAVDVAGEAILGRLYESLSDLLGDEAIQITAYTLPTGRRASESPSLIYGRRVEAVVSRLHIGH